MKCEGFWFVFHLGLFAHLWGLCLHNEAVILVSYVCGLVSAGARRDLSSQGETTPGWILKVTADLRWDHGWAVPFIFSPKYWAHENSQQPRTLPAALTVRTHSEKKLDLSAGQTRGVWPDQGYLARPGVSGQTTWLLRIKWVPEACILVWPLGVLFPLCGRWDWIWGNESSCKLQVLWLFLDLWI